MYFCEVYSTCVSSKLCEFIIICVVYQLSNFRVRVLWFFVIGEFNLGQPIPCFAIMEVWNLASSWFTFIVVDISIPVYKSGHVDIRDKIAFVLLSSWDLCNALIFLSLAGESKLKKMGLDFFLVFRYLKDAFMNIFHVFECGCPPTVFSLSCMHIYDAVLFRFGQRNKSIHNSFCYISS